MTKSKRRQSLNGVVLIMVLVVMVVLIIMLTATLTVVTTAGQRIYTKYEENQAYYTARSALDVFTNNMLSDSDYLAYSDTGIKVYEYTDEEGHVHVAGDPLYPPENMKQGLALQLDLYKIKSQNEDGEDWGIAENAVKGDGTFIIGSPEDSNFTLTDSTGLAYIEYDVTLPKVSDGSNDYSKIVDVDKNDEDGDGDKTDQIAKIKVEVLDRKYSMDTTYTPDQIVGATTITSPSISDIQTSIQNGTRSKDYMKIKITSTVKLMDTEGVAVVIFETTEKQTPATDNALTATGSITGGDGAALRAGGGVSTLSLATAVVGDGNQMSGSVFSVGALKWKSDNAFKINKGEAIVGMGGMEQSSNPTKVTATDDGTYVFLGGTSYLNNGGQFGDSAHDIPVIADTIIKQSATDLRFYGDAYITTFESQSNTPGKIHSTGNIYVENLIIPDDCFTDIGNDSVMDIDLKHFQNANLKLCDNFTIKNASGSLTYTLADFGTNCIVVMNGAPDSLSTYQASGTSGFDINNFTAVNKDGRIHRQYTLPFAVDGVNLIEVPTAQAYFSKYFVDGAFHETTGDLKNYFVQTNDNPANAVNAYSTIYADSNKNYWLLTGADLLAEYLKLPAASPGTPYTLSSAISDASAAGNTITVNSFPTTGSHTIDLSSGDQYYWLDGSTYTGTYTVTGSNGRLILMIPENTTVTFKLDATIQTDEITPPASGSMSIINGTTEPPRVDIYGGTGSKFTTEHNCFFAAYFMMPTGEIFFENGRPTVSYDNGNGAVTSISNVVVVGSVLCNNFDETNQSALIYLSKDSAGAEPGEPHLTVKSVKYTRN